ncbi:hypothetical protein F5Y15DRAFT_415449 [Xylariaceae sp. FL0016]|nr:hypothetical protein F5Y15DRAFT_415449 [Xylariaceae sp. FL0016]
MVDQSSHKPQASEKDTEVHAPPTASQYLASDHDVNQANMHTHLLDYGGGDDDEALALSFIHWAFWASRCIPFRRDEHLYVFFWTLLLITSTQHFANHSNDSILSWPCLFLLCLT